MRLKLALPKGWLQDTTGAYLEKAGFEYSGYHASSRAYRPKSRLFPDLFTKVFHEKDVAIQVAIGNYDLAICGFDWLQELRVKYHSDAVVRVRDLGYGQRDIYAATSRYSGLRSVNDIRNKPDPLRIVSEYPNLAETFALKLRLRRFKVMPVWGAADAYPPEHADVAVLSTTPEELAEREMIPIARILRGNAWLIANSHSMATKDMSAVLAALYSTNPGAGDSEDLRITEVEQKQGERAESFVFSDSEITLALADGHQQGHTGRFLRQAGLRTKGYRQPLPTRRPAFDFPGTRIKVIRPQDMPTQVATGNFDLAITGRDWLRDQLYQFPSSPVEELIDLGFGRVRIVAVVHNDFPVENTGDLRRLLQSGKIPVLRIATEYTNIADKYARDNHLSPYKVIPTWGATEAFLPEDADVLIENTETGGTLAKNNLRIIETLFESTGCLIGNSRSLMDPAKESRIRELIAVFKRGLSESEERVP